MKTSSLRKRVLSNKKIKHTYEKERERHFHIQKTELTPKERKEYELMIALPNT